MIVHLWTSNSQVSVSWLYEWPIKTGATYHFSVMPEDDGNYMLTANDTALAL